MRLVPSRHARRSPGMITLSLLMLIMPCLTACDSVERSLQLIDSAVTSLEAAPGNWEAAGNELIDNLAKEQQSILGDVKAMVSDMVGQAGNLTFCLSDYFGNRLGEKLRNLAHTLDPSRPAPALTPVVCNMSPATHVERADELVTFFGYDFRSYSKQHPFKARIEYGDASVFDDDVGAFSVTSNYQVSLAFQDVDFRSLDAHRNPKIVIFWDDAPVAQTSGERTEIPIQLPAPPEIKYGTFDFRVENHASSGVFSGSCHNLSFTQNISATGMSIDTTKGDPGHPGISQLTINDNRQSVKTLRAYNYQVTSPKTVLIDGRICGARGWGKGAIFSRSFRVYLRSS